MLEVFRRLGSLQFDPLAVAGRNHDLVLHARVAGYDQAWCDLLYERREIFEAYNKGLSLVPTSEFACPSGGERSVVRLSPMRVWALVEAGDRETIGMFVRREDAERALADCLADEPEWRGLLRIKVLELGGARESSLNWAGCRRDERTPDPDRRLARLRKMSSLVVAQPHTPVIRL